MRKICKIVTSKKEFMLNSSITSIEELVDSKKGVHYLLYSYEDLYYEIPYRNVDYISYIKEIEIDINEEIIAFDTLKNCDYYRFYTLMDDDNRYKKFIFKEKEINNKMIPGILCISCDSEFDIVRGNDFVPLYVITSIEYFKNPILPLPSEKN